MSKPQRPDPSALSNAIPLFFIGRSKDGLWVARDADTRAEGIFVFKSGAVRFARRSAGTLAAATMFVPQGLEPRDQNHGRPIIATLAAAKLRLDRTASALWGQLAAMARRTHTKMRAGAEALRSTRAGGTPGL
jgi:hypothetical protein